VCRQRGDEQAYRRNHSEGHQARDYEAENFVQVVLAGTMSDDCGNKQSEHDGGKQPTRPNDQKRR
jgi:hypothetical protein